MGFYKKLKSLVKSGIEIGRKTGAQRKIINLSRISHCFLIIIINNNYSNNAINIISCVIKSYVARNNVLEEMNTNLVKWRTS